mgnify:CR=1 FL=1
MSNIDERIDQSGRVGRSRKICNSCRRFIYREYDQDGETCNCEHGDYSRNFLVEAYDIADRKTMLLPEKAHIDSLVDALRNQYKEYMASMS